MNDHALHHHLIGNPGSRNDLNTPVLIVEWDTLTRNIARMAAFCAEKGIKLRPHAKTHKSADIAKLQLDAGAIGLCCAKLGEAEALADGGVSAGLMITSPVVPAPAIARLMRLNARTEGLMCVVDHPDNVAALGRAARHAGRSLQVLIDIDPGFHRTGVASAQDAVDLYRAICRQEWLRMAGVQFYCGLHQHIRSFEERRQAMQGRTGYARGVVDALTQAGATVDIVTGGGTGTHAIDAELGFFTELQAGSYVFMDKDYLDCDLTGDAAEPPYGAALLVDTRVVSANTPGQVTLDAGVKSLSPDSGRPMVLAGAPALSTYSFMGDEHGALALADGDLPGLGERVTLVTPHCDPTVNLHCTYHVVEGETLRALWPVGGRGRSR